MPITYERYPAKVTNNSDPEKKGRIKATCPDFMGQEDVELPDWINPLFDWAEFAVPDVDEIIEIEVLVATDDDEVPFQSAIFDPVVRYRAKRYYNGDDSPAPRPIPSVMTEKNYPKRRGLVTPRGLVLMFDDTEGDEQVQLRWHSVEDDEDKFAFLAIDIHGITIANKEGSLIFLDSDDSAVLIQDKHGNTIGTNEEGFKVVDKFGNMLVMRDGVIEVLSQGGVTISAANNIEVACDKAHIEAQTEATVKAVTVSAEATGVATVKGATVNIDGSAAVNLGAGAQPAVLGTILETWLTAHVHNCAAPGSPSTPPTVAPVGILSTLVKLS